MTHRNDCPDADTLLAMLDSRIPEQEWDAAAHHVETCASCRDRLETLVLHGLPQELRDEATACLRNPSAFDAALSGEVLQQLTSAVIEHTKAYTAPAEELSLDFLEPSANEDSLGRLGHYEITEVIGRGGMGIALKGRDTHLERLVAIKVLAPELASNPTARKRFLREARAAAAVSHDHVVTTYSVHAEELPYLAMEFIDGPSLQQKIDREGPLEVKEILRIGMQTAWGLSAAHEQGLIHRDIKPSNILLQNGIERVQITDFGLARAADDVNLTRTGEVAGTPLYMSPEQVRGLPVDARSDLFSLGSVMYAMCTGRSPFRAESTLAVLHRVYSDTPRPIAEVNPDVPPWLIEVIDRLLQKDPARRFQSAAEVADLLSQCLAHVQQPAVVPLPDVLPSANRPRSRVFRRSKWYVGAILLALVFGSLGVTEATGVTQISSSVISIVRGDGTLRIEVSDPDVSVTIEGPDIVISGAGPHEIRLKPGEYSLHAQRDGKPVPLEREMVRITRGGREVVRITWEQPDASPATNISPEVASLAHGEQAAMEPVPEFAPAHRLETSHAQVYAVAFSPDGRRALTGGGKKADSAKSDTTDYSLQLWDVQRATEIRRLSGHLNRVDAVAFSPDGCRALSGSSDKTLRLWDVGTGEQLQQLTGHSGDVSCLAFLPDGKRAVSGGVGDGQMILWDLESGQEIRRFDNQAYGVWSVAVSEDGRRALCGFGASKSDQPRGGIGQLRLWDLETGERIQSFEKLGNPVRTVAFLPDGARVVTGDWGGTIRVWDQRSGRELQKIVTPLEKGVLSIAVCPDGRRLVVSGISETSSAIWLYDLETARPVARFRPAGAIVNNVVVTTNGERALAGGFGRIAHVWHVPELESLASEPPPLPTAELLARHQQWLQALDAYEKELLIEPENGWTRLKAVECAFMTGDQERYLEHARAALDLIERRADDASLLLLGRLTRAACLAPGAADDYTSSIETARRTWQHDGRFHEGMAVLFARHCAGDYQALLDSTEEVAPDSPFPPHRGTWWLFRAIALYQLGRLEEANEAFAEGAKALDESMPPIGQGRNLGDTGRDWFISALAVYRQAAPLALEKLDAALMDESDNVELLVQRGLLHRRWQRWAEASADFERAAKLAPDDFKYRMHAAQMALLADNPTAYAQHCRQLERLIATEEFSGEAWRAARIAALAPDQMTDGEAMYRRVSAIADREPSVARKTVAVPAVLYRLGRYDDAMRAITLPKSRADGSSAVAPLWEALIQYRRGELESAREAFSTARRILAAHLQPPGLVDDDEIASVERIVLEREARKLIDTQAGGSQLNTD